jgi:AraC-like DNA-binding protein
MPPSIVRPRSARPTAVSKSYSIFSAGRTATRPQRGWLGALQDPQIGRAISNVHRDPARNWTIASLAHELAMSRSAFAARFTELVGEPVMSYVARWRMQVAVAALKEERATVGQPADRLGYRSEAAFSRAFKRVIGVSPGAIRRSAGEQDRALAVAAAS